MRLFKPNLAPLGRRVRAVLGLLLGLAAVACYRWPVLGVTLGLSSAFVLFEAWRGWCALRACGIKTRL